MSSFSFSLSVVYIVVVCVVVVVVVGVVYMMSMQVPIEICVSFVRSIGLAFDAGLFFIRNLIHLLVSDGSSCI